MITKEHRSMCCEFKGCVEGAVHKSLHKETHKTYITRARATNTRTHPQGRTHAHTHTHANPKASLSFFLSLTSLLRVNQPRIPSFSSFYFIPASSAPSPPSSFLPPPSPLIAGVGRAWRAGRLESGWWGEGRRRSGGMMGRGGRWRAV